MTTLVVGASGATGRLLVEQLLERGEPVKAIVRSMARLPENLQQREELKIVEANLLDLSDQQLAEQVQDCSAVASCLGHNLTLKGLFGHPRRLVTDAARRLCQAIKAGQSTTPAKFVLMNSAGNSNRDLREPVSTGQKLVVGLLRYLVPPHADNEQAADFLRTEIGPNNPAVEWVVVRPDSLLDEDRASEYDLYPSPTRSAIFNAGRTSRINVGHFMAELITNEAAWSRWKGQMPVIYNRAATNS